MEVVGAIGTSFANMQKEHIFSMFFAQKEALQNPGFIRNINVYYYLCESQH